MFCKKVVFLKNDSILQKVSTWLFLYVSIEFLYSFFADAEIGKRPVTEILTFNVTDSSGNVVPNQVLTVVIQPDDNQPPLVKVLSGVQVGSR